ncbi:MAG: EAL domain-containing protein, partial [Porticoccaceae bacterium]|nr:EAL domain-containing protein [Porticoccaceae bacterium]
MAKAKPIWQQLAIATLYLSIAVLYAYTSISPRPFSGMLIEHWQVFSLLALAWLLSSAAVLYHGFIFGVISDRKKTALLEKTVVVSPHLLWRIDDGGVILGIDGQLEEKEGLQAEDFLGRSIDAFEAINPDFYHLLKKAKRGEHFDACCAIGSRYYHHEFFPLDVGAEGSDGVAFQCVSAEITQENQFRDRVELARQIFSKTNQAIVILDRRRIVTSVNSAFTQLTQCPSERVVGTRNGFAICEERSIGFYRTVLESLKRTGAWSSEVSLRRSSGELFTAQVSIHVIKGRLGQINNYVMFFSDLSHSEQTHEELRYLADHDNLTDLPNRRLFLDRLDQGLKRAQRTNSQLAVYFIDLDSFKLINDTYGHPVGDEILKAVGRRLLSAVRHSDTVARLAGDEFTVITENVTDTAEINSIAQKIMGCFEAPFTALGENIDMSASVGIGLYPEDGGDLTSLLQRADEAMYKAKAEGRNGFYSLSEGRMEYLPGAMFFPSELRVALKRGQMELVYQPLHDLRNGRVVGCEGLLRWNHHCRGIISPGDFMTLSEGAGITGAIGQWALAEACQQLLSWRAARVKLDYVSINIANSQINDPGYAEIVIDTLSAHGLHPSNLMLEIAEGVLLRNLSRTRKLMEQLSEVGVRFCVDEFGSSLADYSYIRDIPADTLKIEQRLIVRAGVGHEDSSLIRALVGIGDIVGKKVVAVGVERPGQEALLLEVGCSAAQGYLYGRPMSAEKFG